MTLRTASIRVTIALAILALAVWLQGWWNGARPGGPNFGVEISHVEYPRAMATVLSICACVGWVLITAMTAFSIGELRCRKCRYVLHGLSEPRCPECGEPI